MDSWWWALPLCFDIEINDILTGWEGSYEPLKNKKKLLENGVGDIVD